MKRFLSLLSFCWLASHVGWALPEVDFTQENLPVIEPNTQEQVEESSLEQVQNILMSFSWQFTMHFQEDGLAGEESVLIAFEPNNHIRILDQDDNGPSYWRLEQDETGQLLLWLGDGADDEAIPCFFDIVPSTQGNFAPSIIARIDVNYMAPRLQQEGLDGGEIDEMMEIYSTMHFELVPNN